MDKKALQEALNKAIEMEERGYKFYKETAKKTENAVTERTFNFLAHNEILHIDTIKSFYNTLKEKGEFPAFELGAAKDKRDKDLTIFSVNIKELKEKIRPSDDDRKACEFAMEFENNGYKYYENMLKDARDEKLTSLLEFLLGEESRHYEGIMNLHAYLTDSHNWYMYEEGSFPQG